MSCDNRPWLALARTPRTMLGTGSVSSCGRRSRVGSACLATWLLSVLEPQCPHLVLCDGLPPPRLGHFGTLLQRLLSLPSPLPSLQRRHERSRPCRRHLQPPLRAGISHCIRALQDFLESLSSPVKTLIAIAAFVVDKCVKHPNVSCPSESCNNAGLLVQHVAGVLVSLRILVKNHLESAINKI